MGFDFGAALSGAINNIIGQFSSITEIFSALTPEDAASKLVNFKYKYKIVSYQIMLPNMEPIDLIPEAINRIIITRLYDQCIHPIMEIHTLMPPRVHELIIKNKHEVKVRLRLQAVRYDIANNPVGKIDYINDIFSLYTDDTTPFKFESEYGTVNKLNGGGGTFESDKTIFNPSDYTVDYIISLWKEVDINAMRKVINQKYNNITLSDVLADIYTNSGITKMLISPMDNTQSYDELIVPPLSLMNIPKYLETTFGTYYSGTMSFLDYRCLYILSKNGVCDAYEEEEYRRNVVVVKKFSESEEKRVGTTEDIDNKMYYMYIKNENISMISPATTQDAIGGNNVFIVDPTKNETTVIEGAGKQRGSGNQRIITDNYSNQFNKSVKLSEINETNGQIEITAMDYLEDAFTPNKEFIIIGEDKGRAEFSGFYRIIESISSFSKNGSTLDITGYHKFVFKKEVSEAELDQILSIVNPPLNIKSESINFGSLGSVRTFIETSSALSSINVNNGVETESTNNNTIINPPIPKNYDSTNTTISRIEKKDEVKRNPKYKYDKLGNLLDYDVDFPIMITEFDNPTTINYKKKKQALLLPCDPPRPRRFSNLA